MKNRWATVTIIILLLVFIGYIAIDVTMKQEVIQNAPPADTSAEADSWVASRVFNPGRGQLNAVAVSGSGRIMLGGETFVACYDQNLNLQWEYKTEMAVNALTVSGNKLYAAVQNLVLLFSMDGEKTDEWGPFETNGQITSLSANDSYLAFADAVNKKVFILDKKGEMKYIIGRPDDQFIIPSPYFDVALDSENNLFVANTGNRRIEKRKIDGTIISYFGEAGTDKGAFCGCCNPAHFILVPEGFVTAEKGINRIKILNEKGEFTEFVTSVNRFVPPLPLDIASADGKTIYGANPADSKLYAFTRK